MAKVPTDFAQRVRARRLARGLTQQELASKLGITNVTLSRWEKGHVEPSVHLWERFLEVCGDGQTSQKPSTRTVRSPGLDFTGNGAAIRALVDGERLASGHLRNPAFAAEMSKIDPLPHQRIAVYDHMLKQPRLRFLLADDAGAGKTIMAGLYIREMLSRCLIQRILIVPPAGLVGNWQSELSTLFDLPFQIVVGQDVRKHQANPFAAGAGDRVVCSVDTLRGKNAFRALQSPEVPPYDLVIFDEAHKLSASRDADFRVSKTSRYELAEALAGVPERKRDWSLSWSARHLLLLTATPHMGKPYPYFALWRLLDPQTFSTSEALDTCPPERRQPHFIRRTKEEMVTLDGRPLYPQRITDTFSYELTQGEVSEQALYDRTTDYLRTLYNKAKILNASAARLALGVFQRRLASSTYALLRSLERRQQKLEGFISEVTAGHLSSDQLAKLFTSDASLADPFDESTADEDDCDPDDPKDSRESSIEELVLAATLDDLRAELEVVKSLVTLARAVSNSDQQSKFDRLRSILIDPHYKGEKLLVFTEHKDTLYYLTAELAKLGFHGEVASIHGGMDYRERGEQVKFFRKPAEEGGARIMLCTDAAGEGINLQFCGIMVNYDIPWNPARLEQRMGRIHRYGQMRSKVLILNLIAGATREGRVLLALLKKLEEIRKELRSDKVFDVIGRVFQGVSLTQYMTDTLTEGNPESAISRLNGQLTAEQITALSEKERSLYGTGGDVKRMLPELRRRMESEAYAHLIPGFVRHYVQTSAPLIGLELQPVAGSSFRFQAKRARALDPLVSALAMSPSRLLRFERPPRHSDAVWMHPGEPLFAAFSQTVEQSALEHAAKGAVFVDPLAVMSCIAHIARVTIVRRVDPELEVYSREEVLEHRLVAIRQWADGRFETLPIEDFLVLEPVTGGLPSDAQRLAASISAHVEEARAHLVGVVARGLADQHRQRLQSDLSQRLRFVESGFDYEAAELSSARSHWRKKLNEGNKHAQIELDRAKSQHQALGDRRHQAIEAVRREPDLIGTGRVEFITHALVRPAISDAEKQQHDARIEAIAMQHAIAFERAAGAKVVLVHTPELALDAGLPQHPGFDLLSVHPSGQKRKIEVKGRARVGEVVISSNEWASACNHGADYWLYAVYDCATHTPQLVRVQDPFNKLIASTSAFRLTPDEVRRHREH